MYYIHEYPFRKVFQEAGALGVMCAYNDYDGVPMSANYHYLTEVLRGERDLKGMWCRTAMLLVVWLVCTR